VADLSRRSFLKAFSLAAAMALVAPEVVFAEIAGPKPVLVGLAGSRSTLLELGVFATAAAAEVVLVREGDPLPLRIVSVGPGSNGVIWQWPSLGLVGDDWRLHVAGRDIRSLSIYAQEVLPDGQRSERLWSSSAGESSASLFKV
jgi:hypothetical protein